MELNVNRQAACQFYTEMVLQTQGVSDMANKV